MDDRRLGDFDPDPGRFGRSNGAAPNTQTKAVTIPPEMGDILGWERHPSGYLVTGPDAEQIISDARGGRNFGSSAVFACWAAYTRHYCDPPLRAWRGPTGDPDASDVDDRSPVNALFAQPSPWFTMEDLEGWVAGQQLLVGDAFLVKIRDGGGTISDNTKGRVLWLHPVSKAMMGPARDENSDLLITHYAIKRGGGLPPLRVPIENVIHFRRGIHPGNPMCGIGVVEEIAREIGTDAEATACTEAVMRNLGWPGLIVSPREASQAKIDVDATKAYVTAATTGKRRGEPMVFRQPTDLQQIKVDANGLDFRHVWDHVESRISAVTGVPAVLAGLAVGLANANYATADAMIEYLTKTVLMAAWRIDGARWTQGLRADFGLRPDQWIGYDWLGLAALSDDEGERWTRVTALWSANGLTLGDLAKMLGLPEPSPDAAGLRNADVMAMAAWGTPATAAPIAAPPAQGAPVGQDANAAPALPAPGDTSNTAPQGAPGGEPAPGEVSAGMKALRGIRTKAEVSAKVTEKDIDRAIEEWDAWAKEHEPDLVGMLGEA